MDRLADKIALVTGAASGNGRAIAVRFAQEGAHCALLDIDESGLEETVRLVRQQERDALALRCDVSDVAAIRDAVRRTVERFGRLDIAVANAGVVERETDCFTMTEEQWDRTIDVNLKGVFFTLQAAANQMREQGTGGRLIAIASIMAEWGSAGTPAYCASKGGVKQLVKSFAIAGGPYGITCTGIGPGFIETPMTAFMKEFPPIEALLVDRTPIGRVGKPEEVAAVAAFLASDDASFMNGTLVYPDGGILAGLYSRALAEARLAQERAGQR